MHPAVAVELEGGVAGETVEAAVPFRRRDGGKPQRRDDRQAVLVGGIHRPRHRRAHPIVVEAEIAAGRLNPAGVQERGQRVGHRVRVVEARLEDVRRDGQPGRKDAAQDLRDPEAPVRREGGDGQVALHAAHVDVDRVDLPARERQRECLRHRDTLEAPGSAQSLRDGERSAGAARRQHHHLALAQEGRARLGEGHLGERGDGDEKDIGVLERLANLSRHPRGGHGHVAEDSREAEDAHLANRGDDSFESREVVERACDPAPNQVRGDGAAAVARPEDRDPRRHGRSLSVG